MAADVQLLVKLPDAELVRRTAGNTGRFHFAVLYFLNANSRRVLRRAAAITKTVPHTSGEGDHVC
jgi:hypothetical protein